MSIFFSSDETALAEALAAGDLAKLAVETVADLDPGALGRALARVSGEGLDVWLERMTSSPEGVTPREREIFWAVPSAMTTALAAEESELGRVARRANDAGRTLFYSLVDPSLLALVLDLYALGHPTSAGCQGRSNEDEFRRRRHEPAAYLAFVSAIPDAARASLEADGMHVYGQGHAVQAIDIHVDGTERPGSIRGYRKRTESCFEEDFRDDAIAAVIAANEAFVPGLRRAFGLAPVSKHYFLTQSPS
jgi:hypothetical protein